MLNKKHGLRVRSAILSAHVLGGIALSVATSAVGADGDELEAITVTAQRREEDSQRVPVTMTAISGDTLRDRLVTDPAGLMNVVPNVEIATQLGNTLIGIRGIYSITAVTPNGSPEVAVSVDGVYQSRGYGIAGAMFDVDRIEVLRGPQGTLYGRNATGGTVNIITAKPDLSETKGYASVETGDYGEVSTSGAVSVPIIDNTLAVRASFKTLQHDGYIDDYYNDADTKSARLEMLWHPSDVVSLLVAGYKITERGHGEADVTVPFQSTNHWANTENYPLNGHISNDYWSTYAQLDVDLGFATLTYLPAFLKEDVGQPIAYTLGLEYSLRQISDQVSQELRLASSSAATSQGNWQWVTGLYWLREDQHYVQIIEAAGLDNDVGIFNDSYAAFGQATYAITDTLRATAGLRYTHDQYSQVGTGNDFGTTVPVGGAADATNVGWRAGLETDLSQHSLLYGTISTGYKAGGFWAGGVGANSFAPETLTAFEIGTKNTFLENKLQTNAATFLYNYHNYQATTVIELPGSGIIPATYNAGQSRAYGFEIENTLILTNRDQISLNATVERATFTKFILPPTTNLSGNLLPMVAPYTADVGYQHVFDLSQNFTLTGRASSHISGPYFPDFVNTPIARQSAFSDSQLSFRLAPTDARWSATVFGKNLENHAVKTYYLTGINVGGTADVSPPRTYGVQLDVKF
jgi:iron complex outermembrane recepter protein